MSNIEGQVPAHPVNQGIVCYWRSWITKTIKYNRYKSKWHNVTEAVFNEAKRHIWKRISQNVLWSINSPLIIDARVCHRTGSSLEECIKGNMPSIWKVPLIWQHTYLLRIVYIIIQTFCVNHDGVIKWKLFPRYWPLMRGIQRLPVNYLQKGQWRGALMFHLICTSINGCANNRATGDLRRHHTHYDVTAMSFRPSWSVCTMLTTITNTQ